MWTLWGQPDLLHGRGEVHAAAVEIQQTVSQMEVPGKDLGDKGRGWMVTGRWAWVAGLVSSDSLHVTELLAWVWVV